MSARFGLLGGFLGLTALEAILSTKGSAGRVSGLLGSAGKVFEHLADPTVPAIPDHSRAAAPTTATQSSAPLTTTPAPSGTVTV